MVQVAVRDAWMSFAKDLIGIGSREALRAWLGLQKAISRPHPELGEDIAIRFACIVLSRFRLQASPGKDILLVAADIVRWRLSTRNHNETPLCQSIFHISLIIP